MFNPKEGAEKFTFQAEVNRLMDIIIHSLYSNKVRYLVEGSFSPRNPAAICLCIIMLPRGGSLRGMSQ